LDTESAHGHENHLLIQQPLQDEDEIVAESVSSLSLHR